MNIQISGTIRPCGYKLVIGLLFGVIAPHFAFASASPVPETAAPRQESAFNLRTKTEKTKPVFSDFTVANVCFADMAAMLTPEEKKKMLDSIERQLLDEIYISRYLRL
ncbi:MAG: hypothetical protein K2H70_05280, partial [Bacteroidales bacterium]|nr:hypothetical protein [Bacteroidales bacterium]